MKDEIEEIPSLPPAFRKSELGYWILKGYTEEDAKTEVNKVWETFDSTYINIRNAAAAFGVKVKDPKSDCKHCNGKGYTSINATNGIPVQCHCIEPDISKETKENYENRKITPRNRKERRTLMKSMGKIGRLQNKLDKLIK